MVDIKMRLLIISVLFLGVGVFAEERVKRQATYTFPGPRSDRQPSHRQPNPYYVEEAEEEVYQPPRRQFQAQPVQPQYSPAQTRATAPAAPPPPPPSPQQPAYEAPRPAAPAPRTQTHSASATRRRSSSASSSNRANKYGSAPQQSLNAQDDEEEEQGPDPLTLLLQDSQFSCSGKNDGYYADDSVNCQVFHYCVGGAKHSWMCPENTVFHQVHLNCVPDAQDICSQSQKFHFVNEYLYKPVDYEGPNNTARYSQRYYPDGYVVGDPLVAPQEHSPRRPAPPPQSSYHPEPAPAPRQPPRQVAPAPPPQPQPSYRPAPPQHSQSRPASRPSRPVESYPAEAAPPQGYRSVPAAQPEAVPQRYRPQQAPPQGYRVVQSQSPQAAPPQHASYGSSSSSEEHQYPPQQPQQSRRPAAAQRPTAAYGPPRQQYRPASARSAAAAYQPYASNQAAGVEYDEDY